MYRTQKSLSSGSLFVVLSLVGQLSAYSVPALAEDLGNAGPGGTASLSAGIEKRAQVEQRNETEEPAKQEAALSAPIIQVQPKDEFSFAEVDAWTRLYNSGLKAMQNRLNSQGEEKLLAAIKEAKHGPNSEVRLINARNALAQVYCQMDKHDEAEKLFNWTYGAAKKAMGGESESFGQAAYGSAMISYFRGNYTKADSLCRQSIAALRRSEGGTHPEVGKAYMLMALILGKENFPDEAEPYLEKGLRIMEKSPGARQLDFAEALRTAAVYRQSRGMRQEATKFFERAYEISDKAVALEQPAKLRGEVVYRWEEGSPRALEIPDNDFPLRYMNVKGVRVAATVIDLWELFGILISITNTGDERVVLGLDKVNLDRVADDPTSIEKWPLQVIDPQTIDRIRRERVMWDLTMNLPWLANIQKTRSERGLVPASGHDLFRGPNIFGVYGQWGAMSPSMPEILAVQASPERVQYQAEHTIDNGLIRSSTIKMAGLVPVSLEPFESRTGELFYLNPRCESILLTVRVGNSVFKIPFHCRRRRIS